jgi:catechol 2,3-dioxygenase
MRSTAPQQIDGDTELGTVHLSVTDGENALQFYRDVLGLTPLSSTGDQLRFGTPDRRELVRLCPGALRPFPRGRTGLYHLALAVPSLRELARVEARFASIGYEHYPTDHVMSKSLYLWDGDGNGIEVYKETPEDGTWTYAGGKLTVRDAKGIRRSGRDPIDLRWLLSHLKATDSLDAPIPDGTTMGHIHLHVRDLEEAMHFYGDVLGCQRLMYDTSVGMSDVTWNGYTPHRIAFNVWAGQGAPAAPAWSSGLRQFTIILPGQGSFDLLTKRIKTEGIAASEDSEGFAVKDPSQNLIRLKLRSRVADPQSLRTESAMTH